MVRVKCPPGGETRLQSQEPEPKTLAVRVLKPPGGGSSIMFGDDNDDFVKKATKSPPSSAKPTETATPVTNGSTTDNSGKENIPSPTTENIPSPVKESIPSPVKETIPSPIKETIPSPTTENIPSPTTEHSSNGTTSITSAEIKTPQKPTSISQLNGDASSVTSSSNNTNNTGSNNVNTNHCSTGSAPSTPTTISTLDSPSTPKDSDTKTRLFGEDTTNLPQIRDTPTRKVKDRMKSSIFGSEENSMGVTSCNASSPGGVSKQSSIESVKEKPVESAAPRGRVPPGGFSTKLW